ncbi:MAG TPA: hypothetical protein VFQ07_15895 [Candidatus Polarisedimenticolia bacterium]|nr:hypothetical protein [Candidatus Polarisedimenticolia bacterium]
MPPTDRPDDTVRQAPLRAEISTLAVGLCLAGLLLLGIPYLPFQDVPNHALLLTYDRELAATGNAWLERPSDLAFGYSLYVWIARALAPVLSIDAVLRLLAILAVTALPLATARLAAVLGAPAALAGILSLPFALGWPLRMGLISFVLGVPLALLCAAAAVVVCRSPPALPQERGAPIGSLLGLAFGGAAAYLAHPFAFALAMVLAVFAWGFAGGRSARAAARLAGAFLPALALLAWDTWHGAWRPTVSASIETTPEAMVRLRPVGQALSHIACRTYGIPNAETLLAYLPHLALLLAGTALVRGKPAAHRTLPRSGGRMLLAAAALLTLGTVLVPDSLGRAYLLGSRPALAGMCLAAIAAAAGLRRAMARPLPLVATVTGLACAISAASIARDAKAVALVVGDHPPRSARGNLLVVRAGTCTRHTGYDWGAWDPLRQAWAYALSPDSSTPYLFAEHRYDMVWFRPGANPPHPPPGRVLSDERDLDSGECAERNRERLAGTAAIPGYDGVVVVGHPDAGRRALRESGAREPVRLAPGLWVVSAPAPPAPDRAGAPRSGGP